MSHRSTERFLIAIWHVYKLPWLPCNFRSNSRGHCRGLEFQVNLYLINEVYARMSVMDNVQISQNYQTQQVDDWNRYLALFFIWILNFTVTSNELVPCFGMWKSDLECLRSPSRVVKNLLPSYRYIPKKLSARENGKSKRHKRNHVGKKLAIGKQGHFTVLCHQLETKSWAPVGHCRKHVGRRCQF